MDCAASAGGASSAPDGAPLTIVFAKSARTGEADGAPGEGAPGEGAPGTTTAGMPNAVRLGSCGTAGAASRSYPH